MQQPAVRRGWSRSSALMKNTDGLRECDATIWMRRISITLFVALQASAIRKQNGEGTDGSGESERPRQTSARLEDTYMLAVGSADLATKICGKDNVAAPGFVPAVLAVEFLSTPKL